MKINCSINGRTIKINEAKISIFDNSLFYADGLFETFLAVGNNLIFLDDHLDRLEKGARLIGLRLPRSRAIIKKWIEQTNGKNKAPIKKVRVTLTAGDSAFWAGKSTPPRVIVIVTEYKIPEDKFRLSVSPFRVDQNSPFRNVKTLSFIIEMTSRKKAYSSSYDDSILLNRAGYVAETSSANIFWIKKAILYTTPLSSGCLEGMTRRHILQLAKENNIPAQIKNITLKNLLKADEIFVASSLKLILPVKSIKSECTIYFRKTDLTERLSTILRELINIRN
jgi:branched-subunit amino acid aminotransferase/4-amino-4-deoxychorismate lyase